MIQVSPIKGVHCMAAFNAFNTLLLGLKQLPDYQLTPYEEFYSGFSAMDDSDKETHLRQAAAFVPLRQDEVEALASFAKDKNGVSFSRANIGNLALPEVFEIIVAVCMEIGRMKVSIISESEKKKSQRSPSMSVVST